MRHVICERCGETAPVNQCFLALGKTVCGPCLERMKGRGAEFRTEEALRPLTDPTVCANCGADNGDEELPALAGAPVCSTCAEHFRKYPFPTWVKVSFLVVLILAAYSLIANVRFLQGYSEAKRADRAYESGDIERASRLMDAAADHVPECEDYKAAAMFFRGIRLLVVEDKPAEAAEELRTCKQRWGSGETLDFYLKEAEGSAAFLAKDYDTFLERSRELAKLVPSEPMVVAGLASALACKYAVTGEERFRRESVQTLSRATELAPAGDENFRKCARRIRHRIETRQIVTRQEYERRFPDGHEKGLP